jgi:membrane associated rhomboid family serine protease
VLNPVFVIISINLGVFLATYISSDLIVHLGLQPASVLEEPWTILTSMFVHDGLFHIFANMITLYFFGSALVRLVGSRRFLFIYFGGGILGGILFILLGPQFSIAVGASGAVFALGGALAVMRPNLRVIIFPIPAPMPLWIAVIGIFVILTILPMANILSRIAWEAHLGGMLFGLGAGYLFRSRRGYY